MRVAAAADTIAAKSIYLARRYGVTAVNYTLMEVVRHRVCALVIVTLRWLLCILLNTLALASRQKLVR